MERSSTFNAKQLLLLCILCCHIKAGSLALLLGSCPVEHSGNELFAAATLSIWLPKEDCISHARLVPKRDKHLVPASHSSCTQLLPWHNWMSVSSENDLLLSARVPTCSQETFRLGPFQM